MSFVPVGRGGTGPYSATGTVEETDVGADHF